MSEDMEPLIKKEKDRTEQTSQVTRTLGAGLGGGYGAPKKDFSAIDAGFATTGLCTLHRAFHSANQTSLKAILYYIGCVLSLGILPIIAFWHPQVSTRATKTRVALKLCNFGIDDSWEEVPIEVAGNLRYFVYRNIQYVFDWDERAFVKPLMNTSVPFTTIHERYSQGVTANSFPELRLRYGPNLIDIPIPSIMRLLLVETLHPFYIFQIMSCALWFSDDYYYYASAIVLMSTVSVVWTIVFTRKNLINLREMARSDCSIAVRRAGEVLDVHSANVVPGDIVVVSPGLSLPFDAVLLTGEAVLNEAMLTGESNPVLKYSLPHNQDIYNSQTHKKYTLFCGTKVIQVKAVGNSDLVSAVVIRTGFSTAKGQLFNTILFPKPIKFQFYSDSYKFLLIMTVFALISCGWAFYILKTHHHGWWDIISNSLDLITITVPPALPLVLTIGVGLSMERLREQRIYCISPQRVNFAGKVNLMCFDKTGTLTHDDLSVEGVQPVAWGKFGELETDVALWQSRSDELHPLSYVLASTHALSRIGDNSEFVGHPVDVRMFMSTKWEMHTNERAALVALTPPGRPLLRVLVYRRFEFEPSLQRMSVIVGREVSGTVERPLMLCVKGSPEAVRQLSLPETIPPNFDAILRECAQRGLYVLGCGVRDLPLVNPEDVHTLKRGELEQQLRFVGLLVLENKLKDETNDVIRELHEANIGVLMITGDNVHTAVTVGRNCNIIHPQYRVLIGDFVNGVLEWRDGDDPTRVEHNPPAADGGGLPTELAVTGAGLRSLFATQPDVIERIKIFARTSPDQKTQICEYFIEKGKFVGMSGDGTNDCGALKAAHVGLALSDAEASVVSPFTSNRKSIADVPLLIGEGRCALQTSFSAFKYMILYPVIQLMQAVRLYAVEATLGDFQYLWMDIALVLPLAVFMCWTGPYPRLSRRIPTSSLFNARILTSLTYQIVMNCGGILAMNWYLSSMRWYQMYRANPGTLDDNVISLENAVTFLFGNYPYIITAVAFSTSFPFRKPIYTNKLLLLTIVAGWTLSSLLMLCPLPHWLNVIFEIDERLPWNFRFQLFYFAWALLTLCWGFEAYVTEGTIGQQIGEYFKNRKRRAKAVPMRNPIASPSV